MHETDSQLLMRYLDGECTEEESERVQAKLLEEPQAALELAKQRRSRENWATLPPALSQTGVAADWDQIQKKILAGELPSEQLRPVNWLAWSPYWTWAAAAAVFLLASVVFLLPRTEAPGRATHHVVETVETDLDGVTPIIFVDKQSGWTVVWVDESAAS